MHERIASAPPSEAKVTASQSKSWRGGQFWFMFWFYGASWNQLTLSALIETKQSDVSFWQSQLSRVCNPFESLLVSSSTRSYFDPYQQLAFEEKKHFTVLSSDFTHRPQFSSIEVSLLQQFPKDVTSHPSCCFWWFRSKSTCQVKGVTQLTVW